MVRVGERIQKIRTKKGMSQEKLAERAGIAQSFLSYIERGEKSPTLRTLTKVARALKIPVAELLNSPQNENRANSY